MALQKINNNFSIAVMQTAFHCPVKTNLDCTTLLAQTLAELGMRHVVICPGSRSAPLCASFVRHPLFKLHGHYDERSAAFLALGIAKGTDQPVAIVTTSGSAVGNLLPAIMEAAAAGVALIVITADRPDYLHHIHSHQTADQCAIFGSHVAAHYTLALPQSGAPARYFTSTIAHAYEKALYYGKPVHINIPFEKPLLATERSPWEESHLGLKPYLLETTIDSNQIDSLTLLKQALRPAIFAGAFPNSEENIFAILSLSEKKSIPIFADILSPLRALTHPHIISHYNAIFDEHGTEDLFFDSVIHFGSPMLSAPLIECIKKSPPRFYMHISPHFERVDPHFFVTHSLKSSPEKAALALGSHSISPAHSFLASWQELAFIEGKSSYKKMNLHDSLSEKSFFLLLSSLISSDHLLFIGNSLPIRAADRAFFPKTELLSQPMGNRGLSGIDGNIATAIGIALAKNRTLIACLGDITFLHDQSSLSMIHKLSSPSLWFIFNNGGGKIFNTLEDIKIAPEIAPWTLTPHQNHFSHHAALYNLEYCIIKDFSELKVELPRILNSQHHTIVEICL